MENDVARMMAVDEMIERIIVVYFFVGVKRRYARLGLNQRPRTYKARALTSELLACVNVRYTGWVR